jgi:predicted Zn-dependent protease
VKLNPFNDMYRAEVGLAYRDMMLGYLNLANQAQTSGQTPVQYANLAAENYTKSVAAIESTIKFVPWEYDNYVFLTSMHNLAGQTLSTQYYADAKKAALRGIAVEPFGPAIRVEYGRALAGSGDVNGAIKQTEIAANMDPNYAEAWQLLSGYYAQAGNKPKAISVLKAFLVNAPTNTTISDALAQLEASSTTGSTPATKTP